MATHWDRQNVRPMLPSHNSYHDQTTNFQPPLPEHVGHTRTPNPPNPDRRGRATPFSPLLTENNVVPIPYYEGYTIRPDDLASSEARWDHPPKKSIPATQEDLHTEVIRQRQSGRTACRELEDCHGPKRQYIDRLIRERNASTSLGHFEVAQLRLERIPRDSGRRNSGRNYHARDFKQKDPTKPRQKTVYMHIILQFMGNSHWRLSETPPDNFAPRNPKVSNSNGGGMQYAPERANVVSPISSEDQPCLLSENSQRPILARGYPYTMANEQICSPPSSRYISRGTQTASPLNTSPNSDWCGGGNADHTTSGSASPDDTWTTTTSMEDEMPRNSSSSDDEVVSITDAAAAHGFLNDSIDKESKSIDEYEKPPWFNNLQPVKSPGITDEQTDAYYRQDDPDAVFKPEDNDTDDACDSEQDDKEVLKLHMDGHADYAQFDASSWSGEETGSKAHDHAASYAGHGDDDDDDDDDDDQSESGPMATAPRKLDSIDEDPSTGPTNVPMSEYLSTLPGPPPPQEKLPPSERYKPRPPPNALPTRPSLTRAFASYDGRSIDDTERRSSKRVSFQQAPPPLYTPPSTCTSSPVSPSASPQLPLRTILAKPPPVSISPGQYTPIATSSPSGSCTSPSSPPAGGHPKPYACLGPACDGSFENADDRERHERQHGIGEPPYSECPVCHHTRSGNAAAVPGGLRDLLVAHMNRRH